MIAKYTIFGTRPSFLNIFFSTLSTIDFGALGTYDKGNPLNRFNDVSNTNRATNRIAKPIFQSKKYHPATAAAKCKRPFSPWYILLLALIKTAFNLAKATQKSPYAIR